MSSLIRRSFTTYMSQPVIVEEFKPRKGILSRYVKMIINPKYYSVIDVTDFTKVVDMKSLLIALLENKYD